MLLSNNIMVYIDHKKPTHKSTKHDCEHVLYPRMLTKDYGAELKHSKQKIGLLLYYWDYTAITLKYDWNTFSIFEYEKIMQT